MRIWGILIIAFLAVTSVRADVLFVTDVEGSRAKLEEAFARSGAFALGTDGFWRLLPGERFVYGGDASDRFYGSLWVHEQLVRLAEAHPDRVVLLLGNRDANKPRLTAELQPLALLRDPPWFTWTALAQHPATTPASRSERLRWIFRASMGSPDAFDLRRRELAASDRPLWVESMRLDLAQRLGRSVAVDDEELVVESFLRELAPSGALYRYLDLARMFWRDGRTLYVHGGISRWNFGRVPDRPDIVLPASAWTAALETWYRRVLHRWQRDPHSLEGDGRRAAEELLLYMMPVPGSRTNRRSAVTGRTGSPDNMPWLPPAWVREALRAEGIERIVLGHTPSGDVPSFVRSDDGFEVICADNSYGFRERAATVLRISDDEVRVDGWHRDGTFRGRPVQFAAKWNDGSPLGRYDAQGRLIVAVEGQEALLYRMANFQVSYDRVPVDALGSLRVGEPEAVVGGHELLVGDFDPPTLADRTRVAMLIELRGREGFLLGVSADRPGIRASQHHRMEMLRRTFADFPHDISVVALAGDEPPTETVTPMRNIAVPSYARHATALAAREVLESGRSPHFVHPDALAWIRMHGLYRKLAPRPCAEEVANPATPDDGAHDASS